MPSWTKLWALAIPVLLLGGVANGCKKSGADADAGPEAAAGDADVDAGAADAADASDANVEDAAKTAKPVVPSSPIASGTTWTGNYVCQGTGQLTLRITRVAGNNVSAVNEFVHHGGKSGSFNMSGTFTPATRQLSLVAGAWIKQPPGMSQVNLNGTLSADGHNIAGFVVASGCSTFNVHH